MIFDKLFSLSGTQYKILSSLSREKETNSSQLLHFPKTTGKHDA